MMKFSIHYIIIYSIIHQDKNYAICPMQQTLTINFHISVGIFTEVSKLIPSQKCVVHACLPNVKVDFCLIYVIACRCFMFFFELLVNRKALYKFSSNE